MNPYDPTWSKFTIRVYNSRTFKRYQGPIALFRLYDNAKIVKKGNKAKKTKKTPPILNTNLSSNVIYTKKKWSKFININSKESIAWLGNSHNAILIFVACYLRKKTPAYSEQLNWRQFLTPCKYIWFFCCYCIMRLCVCCV